MRPLDQIRGDLLDLLDVQSQGLVDTDYEHLLSDLESEISNRRKRIYDERRRIHQRLAATSGA